MVFKLLMLVFLLMINRCVYADELSMVDDLGDKAMEETTQDAPAKVEAVVEKIDVINQFMQEEDARIKDIKLLNLDLEKATLQLKKQEIDMQLAKLSKDPMPMPATEGKESKSIQVCGAFGNNEDQRVLLRINGLTNTSKISDPVGDLIIKDITVQNIVLQDKEGKEQTINYGC